MIYLVSSDVEINSSFGQKQTVLFKCCWPGQFEKMKPSMEKDTVQFPRDKQMAFEVTHLQFVALGVGKMELTKKRGSFH